MEIELRKAAYLLAPRIVALVTTLSADGKPNAAPYSFVGPISFTPPLAYFAAAPDRVSLANARATGEFILNLVGEDFGQQAVFCEEKLADRSSRVEKNNLHWAAAKVVRVPRIAEAKTFLECAVHRIIEIPESDHVLVVGKVLHAECALAKNGRADHDALRYLMHVGGNEFRSVGKGLVLERRK
ncbi:MAG: flavin reductase family protein [Candidatus Micrarchaeia archaeon]